MKIKLFICVFLTALLVVSCSSLPRRIHPLQKSSSDQILALAQGKELNQQYQDALLMYDHAMRMYQEFADIDGLLQSMAGTARIKLSLGETEPYHSIISEMEQLVAHTGASRRHHLVLLELHQLSTDGSWSEIAQKAIVSQDYTHNANLQILSYKVQANTYLKQINENDVRDLNKLYKKSLRRMRRDNMPQVVSQAAYSLAYHYYETNNLNKARKYLKVASRIDYANALFTALGYDMWLAGRIAIKEKDYDKARYELTRAAVVMERQNQTHLMDAIFKELETLPKGGSK